MRCAYLGPHLAGITTYRRNCMKWEKPTACDMRFGFEITMYIANR
jgi:coenzyme PQQ precursor peptide PqqA